MILVSLSSGVARPGGSAEFRFVGDAGKRPDPSTAAPDEWRAYLYLQGNEAGFVNETWYHRAGCRRYFVVERHLGDERDPGDDMRDEKGYPRTEQ